MIKIEETEVFNIPGAVRGMRNPMNSWNLSDSYEDDDGNFIIPRGGKDEDLMCRLVDAGPVHRKFMRQIFVSCDITAPLYWWKQFDTYKVGTTANSTSTMHKGMHKYNIEEFSTEYLHEASKRILFDVIDRMNYLVNEYNAQKDLTLKEEIHRELVQLMPDSYNQLRTVTMNYENICSMHEYRSHHKLQEWRDFCLWAETLPYMELFLL